MPAHDPTERTLVAQVAAHSKWAKTADRAAATAPARQAYLERFERQVDPDGRLDPETRAQLAESAKKAYFARLALKSAKARRLRRDANKMRRQADQIEGELRAELTTAGPTDRQACA